MGYTRGFTHGVIAGVVVGVLVAPRPGDETRERWRRTAEGAVRQARGLSDAAQQGWTAAKPAVMTAARIVQPAAQAAGSRLMEVTGRRAGGDVLVVPLSHNGGLGTEAGR